MSPPGKVLVVGPPGVGKSWVAVRLARAYRLPHVELDGFKLKPGRLLAPAEEVAASLKAALSENRWLLDGNWSNDELGAAAWPQADLVVWLDYPRWLVMAQVSSRSVRRLVTREVYYGWQDRLRDWVLPTHPIRWSWKMVGTYCQRYADMSSQIPASNVVHLQSRSATRAFIAGCRVCEDEAS